jgi:glycosyltransferase involved in cell wall biosynthesis
MRSSILSLFESTIYPFELIVIDNGGSEEDSRFFLELCEQGKINTYIRNSDNMSFGYARNQGLSVAQGDYICIADNDLLYKKDWLSECIKVLKAFPEEKIYTTPMEYPTSGTHWKYDSGFLELDGVKYKKNMRAGSNCFVIRREDLKEIGMFDCHRIAGSRWTDNAVHAGYLAVVIPDNLVSDMGLRRGYNLAESIPIKLNLSNGSEVYFNEDDFVKGNLSFSFIKQKGNI